VPHAFIIGGTGQIGHAVADVLLARNWAVTLSHRGHSPPDPDLVRRGARIVRMDRDMPGALASALSGGADAVIDTVCFTEDHADQLIEVGESVGSLVVISSASVYCDAAGRTLDEAAIGGFPNFPEPIKEDQPIVAPGPATYSTRKAALERRLLDHAKHPVTVLRPGAIHGPHSVHPREWWFVKRMLDRRDIIPLAYRGESRFHTSATANIAALVRTALEKPGTRILNAADPSAPSVAEIGAAIGRHLNYNGTLMPVGKEAVRPVGATPWSVPAPLTLDTGAAATLGYRPATTYDDAVGATCDWLTAHAATDWRERFPLLAAYPYDLFDYAAEDKFFTGTKD
jgi:nucleoside-diphosphate-sugar epimerase